MDGSGKEIARLISSEQVEGTTVENPEGESLGVVRDIMIDKISGQVAYAVLKYGSFLGMGGKLFALPWDQLKFDAQRGSYVVDIPEDRLRNAPSFEETTEPNWSDPAWNRGLIDYYGSSAPWFTSY
jgi:hypothetical protein